MSVIAGLPRAIDTTPITAHQRFGVYRDAIKKKQEHGENARASYYLANLALEELAVQVNHGQEPTEYSIEEVQYRFELAADLNKHEDTLDELRSRLLRTWTRPIVWSGVLNIDGLNDSESRTASKVIRLGEAADATAEIAAEALVRFDELDLTPIRDQDEEQHRIYKELKGFLGEATPILLSTRHTTAKQFALPSTAYDDCVNPDISNHVDGFYYDNRRGRSKGRYGYQVATMMAHHKISPYIPEINAQALGNNEKSSRWPKDDRQLGTIRRLVTERRGKRLSKEAVSTLDSIGSFVFNKITNHPQK